MTRLLTMLVMLPISAPDRRLRHWMPKPAGPKLRGCWRGPYAWLGLVALAGAVRRPPLNGPTGGISGGYRSGLP